MPTIDRYLFTPDEDALTDIVFDHFERLPIRRNARWYYDLFWYLQIALSKVGFGSRCLVLDSDTYMVEPVPELFEMLDAFDIAMCHAPARRTANTARPVPLCYPEFNTGVMAVKVTERVLSMFEDARQLCMGSPQVYGDNDQAPLRELLFYDNRSVRVGVIPVEYHCRFNFGAQVREKVKILHGRGADFAEVAKSINAGWVDGLQVKPRLWQR